MIYMLCLSLNPIKSLYFLLYLHSTKDWEVLERMKGLFWVAYVGDMFWGNEWIIDKYMIVHIHNPVSLIAIVYKFSF